MKYISPLIVTFLFFLVAGNHVKGKEADKYISIETALFESSLKLELRSLGGYRDECIELKVTNLLSDSLFVLIEAGRILESEDVKEQNIPPFIGVDDKSSLPSYLTFINFILQEPKTALIMRELRSILGSVAFCRLLSFQLVCISE